MAILKCVGYFYFHIPEGICFAGFLPFLARGYTLHVLHLWGGLNMRYYYLLLFMLFLYCYSIYVFYLLLFFLLFFFVQEKAKEPAKQIPSGI
jgi:hypothetical protein